MLFACSWIADCSAATHEIKLCVSTMSGMSEGACFPFNVSRSIRTSPSRAIGAAWHAPYRMAQNAPMQSRRQWLRPSPSLMPTSRHPKMARAAIRRRGANDKKNYIVRCHETASESPLEEGQCSATIGNWPHRVRSMGQRAHGCKKRAREGRHHNKCRRGKPQRNQRQKGRI